MTTARVKSEMKWTYKNILIYFVSIVESRVYPLFDDSNLLGKKIIDVITISGVVTWIWKDNSTNNPALSPVIFQLPVHQAKEENM